MPGRKNQSEGEKRDQRMSIRFTVGEKAIIEQAARKLRLSMSNFMSHQVIPECEKVVGKTLEQFEHDLSRKKK